MCCSDNSQKASQLAVVVTQARLDDAGGKGLTEGFTAGCGCDLLRYSYQWLLELTEGFTAGCGCDSSAPNAATFCFYSQKASQLAVTTAS